MQRAIFQITQEFARQVNERYKPKAIYLYGSHIRGNVHQHSDIDIAVIFAPIDIHKQMDILSDLLTIATKFDANIEPNVLIDDGDYCRFSFLAEVMETGRLIEA